MKVFQYQNNTFKSIFPRSFMHFLSCRFCQKGSRIGTHYRPLSLCQACKLTTSIVQVSHTTTNWTKPPHGLSPTVRVGWQGSQGTNSWLQCLVDYKRINHFTLVRSAHRIGPGICHPPQSSSREIPSKPQQEFENDDEEKVRRRRQKISTKMKNATTVAAPFRRLRNLYRVEVVLVSQLA